MTDDAAALKQQAGEHAASLAQSGMVIGLGTGSTAIFAIRQIAARLRAGDISGILAVATSRATEAAARALDIPMLTDDIPHEISFVPRCHGLCGSQKKTFTPVSIFNRACCDISAPWSQVSDRRSCSGKCSGA
jgi:hypothetical protein